MPAEKLDALLVVADSAGHHIAADRSESVVARTSATQPF